VKPHLAGRGSLRAMQALKARVVNGRLVLDEPTDLPEGTELHLVPVDEEGDELDEQERAALHQALDEAEADADAGRTVSEEEMWAKLRALP
jgi:hypothetical protein